MLTPHYDQCHIGLSGIRTCDHLLASSELYYYATGADSCSYDTTSTRARDKYQYIYTTKISVHLVKAGILI